MYRVYLLGFYSQYSGWQLPSLLFAMLSIHFIISVLLQMINNQPSLSELGKDRSWRPSSDILSNSSIIPRLIFNTFSSRSSSSWSSSSRLEAAGGWRDLCLRQYLFVWCVCLLNIQHPSYRPSHPWRQYFHFRFQFSVLWPAALSMYCRLILLLWCWFLTLSR